MKILITGYKGFIGRNLCEKLQSRNDIELLLYGVDSDISVLKKFTKQCDFVYHFAAIHRPENPEEFDTVNRVFFEEILTMLRESNNNCPVLLTSSIQAAPDTEYGKSKLAAESALKAHGALMNSKAIVYRLTNTFGRYAKPNHHSVVATFCYNAIHNIPINISNPNHIMAFYYIDDVIDRFVAHLSEEIAPDTDGFYRLPETNIFRISLKELADKILEFNSIINSNSDSIFKMKIDKLLFETLLSYKLN